MTPQDTISKAYYRCDSANKNVKIKRDSQTALSIPESCSGIGDYRCGVVKILYGMTYEVDWKRCRFCSEKYSQSGIK